MSKHRLREDDETTLLPRLADEPAVELPAVREPVAEDGPERPSRRQPVIIAVVTAGLLLSGAAAWALAAPAPAPPALVLPEVVPTTPRAGFVDGFGVVSPSPSDPASRAPAQPPASSPAGSVASPLTSPSPAAPSPSRAPVGAPPPPPAPPPGGAAAAAVYRVDTWPGGYVVSVQVRNTGSEPLQWTVRIQLPAGATVSGDWEVDRATQPGAWLFTPDRGPLAPGATYLFGFIGQRGAGGDFKVTCTVNGAACQAA